MVILSLIGLVGILLILNCIFIVLLASLSSTPTETLPQVLIPENETTVPTEIPLYTTVISPTTSDAYAAIGCIDYFQGKSYSVQYLLCDSHNYHCQEGEECNAELPYAENEKWCATNFNKTTTYAFPCFASAFAYDHNTGKPEYRVSTDNFISIILAFGHTAIVEVPVDRSFFFYKGGIYKPKCEEIIGYQPVIVVGYDKRDGKDVWILRNSFGTEWGIDGDFEMEKGVEVNQGCNAFAYAIY